MAGNNPDQKGQGNKHEDDVTVRFHERQGRRGKDRWALGTRKRVREDVQFSSGSG